MRRDPEGSGEVEGEESSMYIEHNGFGSIQVNEIYCKMIHLRMVSCMNKWKETCSQ